MNRINYQLGKIYKIYLKSDPTKLYVGSTCQPYLCNRLQQHKYALKSFLLRGKKLTKFYQFVKDNGGFSRFKIELIESWPCLSNDHLIIREGYWQRELKCNLNANINVEFSAYSVQCCVCNEIFVFSEVEQHSKSEAHLSKIPKKEESEIKVENKLK